MKFRFHLSEIIQYLSFSAWLVSLNILHPLGSFMFLKMTRFHSFYGWVLEKAMAPHSSTLAWEIPWTEEPGRLQSMESLRVGHDWATSVSLFTFMHWKRKWQHTPVFLPRESQGWQSLVGFRLWGHRVGHDWSGLAAILCQICISNIFPQVLICLSCTLKVFFPSSVNGDIPQNKIQFC